MPTTNRYPKPEPKWFHPQCVQTRWSAISRLTVSPAIDDQLFCNAFSGSAVVNQALPPRDQPRLRQSRVLRELEAAKDGAVCAVWLWLFASMTVLRCKTSIGNCLEQSAQLHCYCNEIQNFQSAYKWAEKRSRAVRDLTRYYDEQQVS